MAQLKSDLFGDLKNFLDPQSTRPGWELNNIWGRPTLLRASILFWESAKLHLKKQILCLTMDFPQNWCLLSAKLFLRHIKNRS